MNSTNLKQIGALTFLFLAACAHYPDVRPGAEGIHRVVIHAESKEDGEKEALSQARDYCGEKKKEAAIIDEGNKYTGDMKEEDYKKMKTAGKVAKAVGGAAYVFGGAKEHNAGGVVGLGGIVADGLSGNGYTVEMKFKCQ